MLTLKQRLAAGESVVVCAVGRVLQHNFIQLIGVAGGFDGL